jgi:hypothetical protein
MKHFFFLLSLASFFLVLAPDASAQNVGIGTPSPTQALDVNGNLRIRGLSGSDVRLPRIMADGTLQVSGPVPATATLTQPAALGTVATGRYPAGVAVAGAYAYVSNQGDNTIQVYSLADPAQPVSLGTVPTTITTPDALVAAGGYLYVTSNQSTGFQIFSLATPAIPASAAVLAMPGGTDGVAVMGSTMYVANVSNNTLMVYDLSNPVAPLSVGSVAAPGPGQLAISGGYLYVASFTTASVQTFSLAVPTAPVSLGTVAAGTSANGAAVVAGRLYIANQAGNTLQCYGLAAPVAPASQGTQPVGGQPYAVDGAGNHLYVANIGANTLQTLQLSVPTVVGFDGSGTLTSVPATSLGDNLGSHTATTTIALNGNWLANKAGANDGLRLDDAGKVGLGTATPGTRLSISPTTTEPKITLWDGNSTTSHYGFGISGFQLNYHVSGANDNHVFYMGGKNGPQPGVSTELMRIKGNGNVGIGTPNPLATLQVARGTGVNGTAAFEGSNRTSHFNYNVNENTYIRGGKLTSDVLLNDNGGNVGIGTSTPAYRLDVSGTIRSITGQGVLLDAQDRPIITRSWDAFTSGSYAGVGRWGLFMEPHRLTFGIPNMPGKHFQWVTYGADSQIDTTLMFLSQYGQLGIGTKAPVARLHLVNDGGGSGSLDDIVLESFGNVGPGISLQTAHGSAAAPLNLNSGDFMGDIGFAGRWNNQNGNGFNSTGLRAFYRGDGTTARTELRLRTSGTDRVVIDETGNVGIGTATPNSLLSITPTSTAPKITLWDGNSTTTHYGFGVSSFQLNYHVAGTTDSHVFYAGGKNADAGSSELMRIKGNGNVGIGTNNPTEKLELNGVLKFTTNDTDKIYFTSFGGANGSKLAHSGGWSLDYYAGPGNTAPTAGYHRFFTTEANVWQERLRIAPDGNVGIGNTNPQASLQVARGSGLNGTAAFEGTNRASHFNYSTTENTYIRGGKPTSNVILNDNGGAVAVGTATVTAGEMLEVNGSTRTTEVHTPATGTANMLALAYCQAGGPSPGLFSSSGNVAIQRLGAGHYRLTITGQSATLDNYPLTASIYGSIPGFVSTDATGPAGTVDVYTFSTGGVATDRIFHFSLFKP